MKTALEQLALIEEYADAFVTHWMEDEGNDAEDKAACQKASDEITAAAEAIRAQLAAGVVLLAALQAAQNGILRRYHDVRRGPTSEDETDDMNADLRKIIAAVAAAEAAGVKAEG